MGGMVSISNVNSVLKPYIAHSHQETHSLLFCNVHKWTHGTDSQIASTTKLVLNLCGYLINKVLKRKPASDLHRSPSQYPETLLMPDLLSQELASFPSMRETHSPHRNTDVHYV
ncbi:hypothetical protein E2C01_055838 [Portunus trituberculatus]|uniref:Uncharacterized protein n=1 Tax=Portunus trituberculatus TaxID=210409 RepID=A0A5B7GSC0_PORTR|nr:hypothetical protein [Portunus trituberculatus]